DQLRTAVENMQKRQQAKMEAEFKKVSDANKAASDSFLAQNKAKPGVKTLASGVQYRVIETGNGAKPTQASDVALTYKGSLPDGTVLIDTNQVPQGQTPGPVELKVSQVPLDGLREALLQMPAGSRWEVVLPGDKAYGNDIRAGRMANQAVVFDVKLVSVKCPRGADGAPCPAARPPPRTLLLQGRAGLVPARSCPGPAPRFGYRDEHRLPRSAEPLHRRMYP